MDKNTYLETIEKMKKYLSRKSYHKAGELADKIDWRKVKDTSALCAASEVYEGCGDYEKSRDILFQAYDRAPKNRKIMYRLCVLAVRLGDVKEATDCYDEFLSIAPGDPDGYELHYEILKLQKAPIDERIAALEKIKQTDYSEKWGYELATLYDEAGRTSDCVDECDDLSLWFGDGEYVRKALELKMKYKPLTPEQKETYSRSSIKVAVDESASYDTFAVDESASDGTSDAAYGTENGKSYGKRRAADSRESNAGKHMATVSPRAKAYAVKGDSEGYTKTGRSGEYIPNGTSDGYSAGESCGEYMPAGDPEGHTTAGKSDANIAGGSSDGTSDKAAPGGNQGKYESKRRIFGYGSRKRVRVGDEEVVANAQVTEEEVGANARVTEENTSRAGGEDDVDTDPVTITDPLPDPDESKPKPSIEELLREWEEKQAENARIIREDAERLRREQEERERETQPSEIDTEEAGRSLAAESPEEFDDENPINLAEVFSGDTGDAAQLTLASLAAQTSEANTGADISADNDIDTEPEKSQESKRRSDDMPTVEYAGDTVGDGTFTGTSSSDIAAEDVTDTDDMSTSGDNADVGDTSVNADDTVADGAFTGTSSSDKATEDVTDTDSPATSGDNIDTGDTSGSGGDTDVGDTSVNADEEATADSTFTGTSSSDIAAESDTYADDTATGGDNTDTGDISVSGGDTDVGDTSVNADDTVADSAFTGTSSSDIAAESDTYADGPSASGDNTDTGDTSASGGDNAADSAFTGASSSDKATEDVTDTDGTAVSADNTATVDGTSVSTDNTDAGDTSVSGDTGEILSDDIRQLMEDLESESADIESKKLRKEALVGGLTADISVLSEEKSPLKPRNGFARDGYEEQAGDLAGGRTPDGMSGKYETAGVDLTSGGYGTEDAHKRHAQGATPRGEDVAPGTESGGEREQIRLGDTNSMAAVAKALREGASDMPEEEEQYEKMDKSPYDTGFIVKGRYELEAQSEIGTRAGLTEEEKKLFSYFVPVKGMSEQLVEVLDSDKKCTSRYGTSRVGNIVIIGRKGCGKTVLAVDVVKAVQKNRKRKPGKVGIVTAEAFNKKDVAGIMRKLNGGAIIIEKASKLSGRTVEVLSGIMEGQTGELLVILEDERRPMERLMQAFPQFAKKFTSRLEIPVFTSDELVTFAQIYAKENGYKLDEMAILALYSKIDTMQREERIVTVSDIKEIMDDAIDRAERPSLNKMVGKVFGKGKDDSNRVLLRESDFK